MPVLLLIFGCGSEIDTPGEGQLHGLITVAGNPAVSAPGARRLDAALGKLDAMIATAKTPGRRASIREPPPVPKLARDVTMLLDEG